MRADVGALRKHRMPSLPLGWEAGKHWAKSRLTVDRMAEAGVIGTTVAVMLVLSSALQLGLERYVLVGF